jgi:hypothetical protein
VFAVQLLGCLLVFFSLMLRHIEVRIVGHGNQVNGINTLEGRNSEQIMKIGGGMASKYIILKKDEIT